MWNATHRNKKMKNMKELNRPKIEGEKVLGIYEQIFRR